MGETVELKLADGTGVVVELSPAPAAHPVDLPPGAADLPPSSVPVVPVGRALRAAPTGRAWRAARRRPGS